MPSGGPSGSTSHTALRVLAGEEWKLRQEEFFEHYVGKADEVMLASTSFLPGAVTVLRTLRDAGVRVGVVTTKYRYRVEQALERDGLRELVEVIVGFDDVPTGEEVFAGYPARAVLGGVGEIVGG